MTSYTTLVDTIQQRATDDRSITYIEAADRETTLSYASLYQRALARLFFLQQRGLRAGDECILFLHNNQDFVDSFWACILGGMVPVPVAVGISDEHRSKLFKIFAILERPHLYTTQDNLDRIQQYAAQQNLTEAYAGMKQNTLLVSEATASAESNSSRGEIHTPSPDDLAFIQFSSGSTSDPKGVLLTHKNIMTNINAIGLCSEQTEQDISLSWMPLTHDMGLIGFHLNMMAHGTSQCLMATDLFSRRPLLWMKKVSEKKATILCSPNFGYKHFLKALSKKPLTGIDLSSVRLVYNGAEPISIELCDTFLSTMAPFGLRPEVMFTVYGMAEATLAVSFPNPGKNYRAVHVNRHQLKTGEAISFVDPGSDDALGFAILGKPVLDCLVRITGDGQALLDEAHVGNIQISGASVTSGYYKNDAANAAAITADGWLDTGDMGFMLDDELIITGRAKDIIFANGLNYYPHDLETLLQNIDKLELGKIVVYGVWSEALQRDELLVFILYRADLKDFLPLQKQVARVLSEEAGLEVDQVLPVNRIPKTTSGKVQRRILGEAYSNGEYTTVMGQIFHLQQPQPEQIGESLTQLQFELKSICDSIVEKVNLGVHDSFFDAGISSLMLAEIHQKIEERYPGKVDVVDLFDHETIAELAQFMEEG